jgi:hypothetical protein
VIDYFWTCQYQLRPRSIIYQQSINTYQGQDQLFLNMLIPIEIKTNYLLTRIFQCRSRSIISCHADTNQDHDHFFSGWSMSVNGCYQESIIYQCVGTNWGQDQLFLDMLIPIEIKINYFLSCRYQSKLRPFFMDGQCQSMVDTKNQLFINVLVPIKVKINYFLTCWYL